MIPFLLYTANPTVVLVLVCAWLIGLNRLWLESIYIPELRFFDAASLSLRIVLWYSYNVANERFVATRLVSSTFSKRHDLL